VGNSAAPPGLADFIASNPQLKLRAIFIRRPATTDRVNAGLIDLIPFGFSAQLSLSLRHANHYDQLGQCLVSKIQDETPPDFSETVSSQK
jgi:hypothetical protein